MYKIQIISYVNEITYLGMKFDCKLNWSYHLKNVKNKCHRAMKIIKVLSKQSWGADRKKLTTLYKALIRSRIEYGALIYNSASENILKILNPIQNQYMRFATGAFCTTPIQALVVETNEPPLEVRRKNLIMKFVIKVLIIPKHPCYRMVKTSSYLKLFNTKNIRA